VTVSWAWRGAFENAELNELHAEGFGGRIRDDDWLAQVERWSLGWVTARDDQGLVGFVNVAWDGGIHAFVLDTLVAGRVRRRGIGQRLVAVATEEARRAGCEWLHVDFDEELNAFYFEACGFVSTSAGVIALGPGDPGRATGDA
jgi:GNAT superfamily N-acetyltransferase